MQSEEQSRGNLQLACHWVISSSASSKTACYGCRQMRAAHLASGPGMVQRTCSRQVGGDLARCKGASRAHDECCNHVRMVGGPLASC